MMTAKTDIVFRAFRAAMAEHSMPRADSHILIAFSGGIDSTALLCLTQALVSAQRTKPRVTALHVNHGIRSDEALRDADFCRQFCAERKIPFVLFAADAPAEARQSGLTLEEAARNIRYRLITDYLASHPDITCVLTAHHADDQAETVLFRLLRGTSLRGLSGIPKTRMLPVPDDRVLTGSRTVPLIRPLLSFTKAELEAYLEQQGVPHVTDSTNFENDAARNLLRNTLIPAANTVNPAFSDALLRFAAQAEEDEAYFSAQIDAFFRENRISPTDPIPISLFQHQHPAIKRRILAAVYDAYRATDAALKPLTGQYLDAMLCAVQKESGTGLSGGWRFTANGGVCQMLKKQETEHIIKDYQIPLIPAEITELPPGGVCLLCDGSVKASENLTYLKNIYKFFISTHINSDKLIDSMYLRPRHDSQTDRYLCGGSHKTVKDALSAHHVPVLMRRTVPLFCDGDGIVWIPFCGIRDSVNPRFADRDAQIFDLYYFYNSEV